MVAECDRWVVVGYSILVMVMVMVGIVFSLLVEWFEGCLRFFLDLLGYSCL